MSSDNTFTTFLRNNFYNFLWSQANYSFIPDRNGNLYWRVRAEEFETGSYGPWSTSTINYSGASVDVKTVSNNKPKTYNIDQNYPNPFNPATNIRYALPFESRTKLTIYDMLGKKIDELVNADLPAGWYDVTWNANVSSGIYFYRIEAVNQNDPNQRFIDVKKMILMR